MKQLIMAMMLLAGINGTLFAQTGSEEKFNVSQDDFDRRFTIDLGKGNKLQIELKWYEDLSRLENIDSLLRSVMMDLEPLRDSMKDQRTVKRIDYVIDTAGRRELRFHQWLPDAATFIKLPSGEFAALKTGRDTLTITETISFWAKYTLRAGFRSERKMRVSLFVNDIAGLGNIVSSAELNAEIKSLKTNQRYGWSKDPKGGLQLTKDPKIKAKQPRGFFNESSDILTLGNATASLQNYKNYFVPALSVGARVIFNSATFKREIAFSWEPQFLFQTTQGKTVTYRNDFLTLTYGQGGIKDHDPRKNSPFLFNFSFAYQVRNKGTFYDKRTMRLGLSGVSLFEGKTGIEPIIYFHDLFKNVTPGIRLTQHF